MSTSTLLLSLFKYKAWANEELFADVAKLDEEVQKTERHAAIRILNHTYVVDRIFAAHLSGLSHPYAATNTTETPGFSELLANITISDQWYVQYVANLQQQALSEILAFTFTDNSSGQMSREEMLAHVVTHGGYHRGAVGRILAQASIAPPRDIFTGYLHKSEPQRRAI